jgi:uncharacterized OB-fold protein
MPVCPNCGNQAAENAIFCDQCGTRLPVAEAEPAAEPSAPAVVVEAEVESAAGGVPEGVLICPNCGAENVPGEVFCDVCGEPLEAPEPVSSAAVPEVELEPVLDAEPALEVETVLEVAEGEVEPAAAEAAEAAQVYCPVCGAAVHPGDTFCGTCGASLTAAAEEQTLVEEPVVVEEAPVEDAVAQAPEPEEVILVEEPAVAEEQAAAEEQAVAEEPAVVEAEVEEVPASAVPEAEEAIVEEVVEEPALVEEEVEEEPILAEVAVDETVLEEPAAAEEQAVVAEEAEVIEEPVLVEEEAAPAEAEELRCPVCGAIVLPEQRFCASCGAALPAAQAAAPQETAAQGAGTQPPAAGAAAAEGAAAEEAVAEEAVAVPEPVAPAATGPYLEVADSGAYIPLIEQPELLIGRVDDVSGIYPDVDMTPHGGEEGGVSRRHALLGHERGAWYIVDLDSTNGTYVNGVEIAPQVHVPVEDGDQIGLGDAEVVLHLP